MTNQEIMDLADQYLYDTGGKNYGIIEFARAIESRTRASVIGEWFEEGVRTEREACIDIVRTEIRPGDDTFTKIALHTVTAKIQARGE